MRERFGDVPAGYIREVPNTPAGGEEALRALLALDEPPTAVVTSTDTLAVGVLYAAYSDGPLGARATCRSSASTTSCSRPTRSRR